MRVLVVSDPEEGGAFVADSIAALIRTRPDAVLGVATGSTPLPVYSALRERLDGIPVDRVRAFALDEYVGLPVEHPESYRSVITREFVEPLGLDPARVQVPDGALDRLATAGDRYEAMLNEAGGVDLQILGIGANGHIGFNEPGSAFASRTRVVDLAEQTILDNARFFPSVDDVPRRAVTQGIATILDARELALLAFGAHKADAVARAVEGPVTEAMPASVLQRHPAATLVIDEAAAAGLTARSAELIVDRVAS